MTHDIEVLTAILEKVLFVAAFLATAFPVLYMFSPWWGSWMGRILMLHGVSLALAMDMTCLFLFWTPTDILVYFWIQLFVFSLIGVANALMCWMLWRANHTKWTIKRSESEEEKNDGAALHP